MSLSQYVIGADVGSSGLKAALVHAQAGVIAVAERSYPMHRPRLGWAENDPDDWFNAFASATAQVMIAGEITDGGVYLGDCDLE